MQVSVSSTSPTADIPTKEHSAVSDRLTKLPPFHPAAMKLLTISGESETAISEFEKAFKSDPALTADLLMVANSAAFGFRARVDNIRHALTLLGLERVRSLGFTIAMSMYVRNLPNTEDVRAVWAHSTATAVIAEVLGRVYSSQAMYTAGLVHDLGRLGLLLSVGKKYGEILTKEFADMPESMKLEKVLFGVNHCEAGALVSRTWGFPDTLQSSMANHHEAFTPENGTAPDLIRISCQMADWLGFPEVKRQDADTAPALPPKLRNHPELDPERLRGLITKQIAVMST
ncbi:MAG TPA: HDOD domain-containing protein [Bryobacteraceae bacterium]|nr:HDOD domain-containing protein [Bryobacteraceae bacterium]